MLVGHSFGGLVSRAFASAYPETVAALVLIEAAHEDRARTERDGAKSVDPAAHAAVEEDLGAIPDGIDDVR